MSFMPNPDRAIQHERMLSTGDFALQGKNHAPALNETCPWSGKSVSPDSLTVYRGRTVGFCNPECRDKFEQATRNFDALIDAEEAC
jgi:YHS domain-containing protein